MAGLWRVPKALGGCGHTRHFLLWCASWTVPILGSRGSEGIRLGSELPEAFEGCVSDALGQVPEVLGYEGEVSVSSGGSKGICAGRFEKGGFWVYWQVLLCLIGCGGISKMQS